MSANLRAVAATCCYQVVDQGKSLSDVLPKAQLQFDHPADKSLLQEICFGVLRHLPLLDFVCQQLMAKPLIKQLRPLQFLIYVGIYQLKFLRIPDHAAVGETVEAARYLKGQSMTKLINGVLRSVQRKPELFDVSQAPLPVQTNHPSWLVNSLQQAYPQQWQQILAANQQKAPLWLRVNVQRCSVEQFCQALTAEAIEFSQPEPGLPQAILLAQATDVVLLPGYLDGWFAVQDLAAQYAALFLAPENDERILDACCAPGGKTGHILEIAPQAQVLALDKDAKRLDRVRDNLTRLGHQAEIKAADAATPRQWWDGQPFDRILLDVPCSATGVIRRHPDIRWLRKAADIQALATLQQQILIQIWPLLKPGGTLLYATCSVLPAENHQQISQFLAHHPDAEAVALGAGINDSQMQILPGEQQADGFFYAKLSKKANG
ncbi:16S rRNA (cytosine(967)-C(5))-methyltransferase RsmB [Rheinheimera sp. 4Y26]|uniref:16S rRNA (cytosine(967)-C(5))-methyltransferase RsmB n=1 Tax=Rheinheimera sp. 4Y26 TaxID=2977811 RepID=UPI0021B10E3A|nr:16S rRNA (cytosine(967)-C(5))-methyltransferase RsmB [Rheinheimera sp. 4Y26]MCT6700489.1 16S rRNA (cytosine(967)-C(5))-methyltransferase RsmB [Rheinheimera sp. 4Y26]